MAVPIKIGVVEKIANARVELLEVWQDRVLDAATLEEVFFDARH